MCAVVTAGRKRDMHGSCAPVAGQMSAWRQTGWGYDLDLSLKRCFDICVAAIMLAAFSFLFALIAALIKFYLGSPVLFRQVRPGLDARPFEMIKFRTMRDAVGVHGRPLADAERLTPFGRWLRSSSLDELPELWNVLKGEMSLVGPRPLLMEYVPLYSAEQSRRHEVRPGITGWAQVNGRNAIGWDEKFRLDVWYVDNASLALDLKILLLTIQKVVVGENISSATSLTMERFIGQASMATKDDASHEAASRAQD